MAGSVTLQRRTVISLALAALFIAGMAAAWRWTPLHEWTEPSHVAGEIRRLAHTPWMPLMVAALYVAGNFMLFPNTLLNGGIILALGTGWGIAYALGGSLFSGCIHYALGRRYGEKPLRKLDIDKLDAAVDKLQDTGVPGMITVRMLPIAPYGVVNLMVGAAGISLPVFLIGTTLGLLPGALTVTAFGHQLEQLIKEPEPMQAAILMATAIAALAALWGLRRLAESRMG